MKDEEQHDCGCGPEGLVKQVRDTVFSLGMKFSAENALPAYDDYHYDQIVRQSYDPSSGKKLFGFTYLRFFLHIFFSKSLFFLKNFQIFCFFQTWGCFDATRQFQQIQELRWKNAQHLNPFLGLKNKISYFKFSTLILRCFSPHSC